MNKKKEQAEAERRRKEKIKLLDKLRLEQKKQEVKKYKQILGAELNIVKEEKRKHVLHNREKILSMSHPINSVYQNPGYCSKSPTISRKVDHRSVSSLLTRKVASRAVSPVARRQRGAYVHNSSLRKGGKGLYDVSNDQIYSMDLIFYKFQALMYELESVIKSSALPNSNIKKELMVLFKEINDELTHFSRQPVNNLYQNLDRYRLALVDVSLLIEGLQQTIKPQNSQKGMCIRNF